MLSRSRKAFTLLELIVVIVILGLLAALAIPTFTTVINNAKKKTAIASAESIGRNALAIHAFAGDGGLVTAADVATAASEASGAVVKTAFDSTSKTAVVTVNNQDVTLTFGVNTVKGS